MRRGRQAGLSHRRPGERLLVPEMVMHGRGVRPRPLANLADRGVVKSNLGEDGLRRIQKLLLRFGLGGVRQG